MLNLEFKCREKTFEDENVLRMAAEYFNLCNEPSWFQDKIIADMIADVDKSRLEGLRVVSPVLGDISVRDLSGGCKTLICMYNMEGAKILSHELGDNCFKWVLKMAEKKDVTLVYSSIFIIPDECLPYQIRIVNDGSIVQNHEGFLEKKFEFCDYLY